MSNEQNKHTSFMSLFWGGLIGGIAAILFAPKSGKEIRSDIIDKFNGYLNYTKAKADKLVKDAKENADGYVKKAEEILNLSKKYAEGKYQISSEKIEKEILSLRTALNAAVDTYKNGGRIGTDVDIDKSNGNNYSVIEDESLPKHEGMKRRRGK